MIRDATLRYLTHAMLGWQRWLPRDVSGEVRNVSIKRKQPDSESYTDVAADNEIHNKVEYVEKPAISTKISLAEGIELSGNGVLVYQSQYEFAWFLPLPWRCKNQWLPWRDVAESDLLMQALQQTNLTNAAKLLQQYHQQDLHISTLPEQRDSICEFALPASVKMIFTFSGLTWQYLVAEPEATHKATIDWHGRQVEVRCLPHPYCCLMDSDYKRVLWQTLIKLSYEI